MALVRMNCTRSRWKSRILQDGARQPRSNVSSPRDPPPLRGPSFPAALARGGNIDRNFPFGGRLLRHNGCRHFRSSSGIDPHRSSRNRCDNRCGMLENGEEAGDGVQTPCCTSTSSTNAMRGIQQSRSGIIRATFLSPAAQEGRGAFYPGYIAHFRRFGTRGPLCYLYRRKHTVATSTARSRDRIRIHSKITPSYNMSRDCGLESGGRGFKIPILTLTVFL